MRPAVFVWLAIAAVLAGGVAGAATLVAGPQLEFPAPDTAIVCWTTDVTARGRVRFGTEADQLTQRQEGGVTNQHRVTLHGLRAGVRYYFVVGTARQSLATNTFIAGGGTGSEVARANPPARRKASATPALIKAPPARETWGDLASLPDHFHRHGADFRAKDAEDYARLAWEFLQRAKAQGLPAKRDGQGVLRVFDPKTGTFGAYNRNGTTRTFFKPGSRDYFERQPGRPVNPKTLP